MEIIMDSVNMPHGLIYLISLGANSGFCVSPRIFAICRNVTTFSSCKCAK